MDKEKFQVYQRWCNELITLAIRDYDYDLGAIEPLVTGHCYQPHFERGDTPREAIEAGL